MTEPTAIAAALALLAGEGRVRIPRIPCELAALKVIKQALAERDARIAELEDPDQCGEPAPELPPMIGVSVSWCVRRPGHGVPHRDRDGAEWMARVEAAP